MPNQPSWLTPPRYALIAVISICAATLVLLNPIWLRDLPPVPLDTGPLAFSGERAYARLAELSTRFPHRVAGTSEDHAAANWMADQFRASGLTPQLQTFAIFAPYYLWNTNNTFLQPIKVGHTNFADVNVVAISPGSSPEAVILLAHRDVVASTGQGAIDNGSGNAVILELAQVLSSKPHKWTYIFVSTDGEEQSKLGAEQLIRAHPEWRLRLALAPDSVAYRQATTVALVGPGNARHSNPLWTIALMHAVLAQQGLTADYLNTYHYYPDARVTPNVTTLTASLLNQRGLGVRIAVDAEPFNDRGIPALGIEALDLHPSDRLALLATMPSAGNAYDPLGPTHTTGDALVNVSPATLAMTGRFIERYLRSLEVNQFSGDLTSTDYVIWRAQYLPPLTLQLLLALLALAGLGMVVVYINAVPDGWAGGLRAVRAELPRIGLIALAAVLSGLLWQLGRAAWFQEIALVWVLVLAFGVNLGAGVAALRWHPNKPAVIAPDTAPAYRRLVLVFLLTLIGVGYAAYFQPLTALELALPALLLFGAAPTHGRGSRIIWSLLFLLWSGLHLLLCYLDLYAMANRVGLWDVSVLPILTLNSALWLVAFIYGVPQASVKGVFSNAASAS